MELGNNIVATVFFVSLFVLFGYVVHEIFK